MRFSDIPGNENIKKTLRGYKESGHIPHAVMISGPAGSGKMLLARAYAQYLHCENPRDGEPCGICSNCLLHKNLSHPDLHFVYPLVKSEKLKRNVSKDIHEYWLRMLEENPSMSYEKWLEIIEAGNSQPMIYVNEANDIVLADSYPPYTAKYKIFIVWLPERMNIEAANKLLKVIEEPSDGTIFIFVSNNDLMVLPTIFSRVQRLSTGRLSDDEIAAYLTARYHVDPSEARRDARACDGSLIKADEAGTHTGENAEFLSLYQEIMRAAYAKKVAALKSLADATASMGREKIRRFLDYMSRMIRENFIYNLSCGSLNSMTEEEEKFSTRFSPFINHANVEDFAEETDKARRDIERNGNAKLILFDYFIICIILLHRKS